jgi:hypothetical protein
MLAIFIGLGAPLLLGLIWHSLLKQSREEDAIGERSEAINEAWEHRMKGGD